MAINLRGAYGLIGGATGDLDAIDGAALVDKEGAVVITQDGFYVYALDADSAAAESSPEIISPDTNAGDKRWILQAPSSYKDTFDMTITPATSGTATVSSGENLCAYTKIGNIVHVQGRFLISAISSPVGDLQFLLPFTSAQFGEKAEVACGSVIVQEIDFDNSAIYLVCSVGSAKKFFTIEEVFDDAASDALDGADLGGAGDERITFSLTYMTD